MRPNKVVASATLASSSRHFLSILKGAVPPTRRTIQFNPYGCPYMTQISFGESDCPVDNFYVTIGAFQRRGDE